MFDHCGTILVCVTPAFILLKYLLFADHKGVQESPVFDLLIIVRGVSAMKVPRTLQNASSVSLGAMDSLVPGMIAIDRRWIYIYMGEHNGLLIGLFNDYTANNQSLNCSTYLVVGINCIS
jgi:hypothetical protein